MKTCKPGFPVSYAVTAEQMRDLDRKATEKYGIPSLILMENAGLAIADEAVRMVGGDPYCKCIVIVAGQGNNGGDGFAAARHLENAGATTYIFYFGDREAAKGDALTNIEIAEKMKLDIFNNDLERLKRYLRGADLVVDALLGTGIKGELREPYRDVIELIRESGRKVLSVDIPSGVNADTGVVYGTAVGADVTVTFAMPKIGLLTGAGVEYVGELKVADISIPGNDEDDEEENLAVVPDGYDVAKRLPLRWINSNKGNFGHLTIVAGSVGMTGAATLAADGALRIGTGLVTLLVPESLNDIMEVKVTEAMTIPVPQGKARAFGMASLSKVLEYVGMWDAAVIGPGFGRDEDTIEFTLELIRRLERPAIIDADALYAVSKDLSVLKDSKASIVITPHPGEMARLLGTTAAEVQSNRLEVAKSFANEHGVTVLLKGAGTVVSSPDDYTCINTTGNPGMATGGTGDVLSGMIGGLLAQKLNATNAAVVGAYLHGLAGDIAAKKLGEAALIASDVADSIGEAIQEILREPF